MSDDAVVTEDQVLGITICPHCQKRFRVPKKHESLIGKSIRCPSCHQPFEVNLEVPSQLEQAAISNAEQAEEQKAKRTRRTKNEIRDEFLSKIGDNLKTLHKRLTEIGEQCGSEEQVRIWCIDVLKAALGYESSHIDTEVCALGQRIDIALKEDDKIFLVIECKNPRSKLPAAVRDQAVMYAVNKSADWAVATNGAIWKLWRVVPRKGQDPIAIPVFDIALLDEDGISDADVANFYLLTRRALFNGETTAEFHRQEAANEQRILRAMNSERVVTAVTKVLTESYQTESGERVSLADDFIARRLAAMFLPDEL